MKHEPGYYAVIPAPVLFNEKISFKAKILYAHISTLTKKEGYCWASNSYFTKIMNISQPTLNRAFLELEQEGYITRDLLYKENSKEIDTRIIRLQDTRYIRK